MKKVTVAILLCCLCWTITGCRKCISTNEFYTKGVITDMSHTNEYISIIMVPMQCGKITTLRPQPITHAETNVMVIEVDGITFEADNKSLYDSHNIGDKIECLITEKSYDDGTVKKHARLKE